MISSTSFRLFVTLFWALWPTGRGEDPWRFLVVADWHGAEPFVFQPINDPNNVPSRHRGKVDTFTKIQNDYGGELVLLPGDTESGKWYQNNFLNKLPVTTHEEAVREAGERCYRSVNYVFELAGYSKVLMAVGDHELGGNPWLKGTLKTKLLPSYRDIFFEGFNKDSEGNFLYQDPIGNAPSRPIGTLYERTSYAYRHKNVLFVTIDAFKQLSNNFQDKRKGLGGEGTVTSDVSGAHLTWFRNVLDEAQKDPTIKHTVVQAHLPILQPVRKTRCTGQFMDNAERSPFFQAMRDYNVDVYFAGEVHANTATKDDESNVLQIVSRGNGAQNFILVEATDDSINITQYNEIGPKPRYSGNYEFYGQIVVDKTGPKTTFESRGSLKLLDRQQPMIYFPFEEIVPLKDRPVLALIHDNHQKSLVQKKITVLGVECFDSFPNRGAFDQPYDAQVANVVLRDGIKGKAAKLNSTSRVAVFSLGPHSGGVKISYALWLKTQSSTRNQLLVHFGSNKYIGNPSRNLVFSLTLDKGVPVLHASSSAGRIMKLVPKDANMNLANDEWQHVALSMPKNSCLLSEVHMYVNGQRIATKVEGMDDYLFITIAGHLSIGGFGHSDKTVRDLLLPGHKTYLGLIDEVYVWTDRLTQDQVTSLSRKPTSELTSPPTTTPSDSFLVHTNYRCSGENYTKFTMSGAEECEEKCRSSNSCLGYDVKLLASGQYKCFTYQVNPPELGWKKEGAVCGIKVASLSQSPTPVPTLPSTTESSSASSLSPTTHPTTMQTPEISFTLHANYRCRGEERTKFTMTGADDCEEMCRNSNSCLGYDVKLVSVDTYRCLHYQVTQPVKGWKKQDALCGIKN